MRFVFPVAIWVLKKKTGSRLDVGSRYRHVNFKMTEKWPLDAVENIPELFRVGEERAAASYGMISENFFQHQRVKFTPLTTTDDEINLDESGFVK